MNALTTFSRLIAACLLLPLRRRDHLAERLGLGIEIELAQEVADRLRAHAAAEVDAEAVRRPEPVLHLAEDLLVVDDHLRLELLEQRPGLLEARARLDAGLARVLAPLLDVEVHLAHLHQPGDDRVEILLLDLPVRLQAEVVRELAERRVVCARLSRGDDVLEQPLAEAAGRVELLLVDGRDESGVLLVQLAAAEQAVEDAVHDAS